MRLFRLGYQRHFIPSGWVNQVFSARGLNRQKFILTLKLTPLQLQSAHFSLYTPDEPPLYR